MKQASPGSIYKRSKKLQDDPTSLHGDPQAILMSYLKGRYHYLKSQIDGNDKITDKQDHKKKLLSTINIIKRLNKNLQAVWEENSVESFYKEEFMERVCAIPLGKMIDWFKKEILAHSQKSSPYYKAINEMKLRQEILLELKTKLQSVQTKQSLSDSELAKICKRLAELRLRTLAVVEAIEEWRQDMRRLGAAPSMDFTEGCRAFVVEGRNLVETIKSDTEFLRKSFLTHFISFGNQTDPLLLSPYKLLINSQNSFMQKHDCVVNLFDLNFDMAFRLNQAQKALMRQNITILYPPIKAKGGNAKQIYKEVFSEETSHQNSIMHEEERVMRKGESKNLRTPKYGGGDSRERRVKGLEDKYLNQQFRSKKYGEQNQQSQKNSSHLLPRRKRQSYEQSSYKPQSRRVRTQHLEHIEPRFARAQSLNKQLYQYSPTVQSKRQQPKVGSRVTLQPIEVPMKSREREILEEGEHDTIQRGRKEPVYEGSSRMTNKNRQIKSNSNIFDTDSRGDRNGYPDNQREQQNLDRISRTQRQKEQHYKPKNFEQSRKALQPESYRRQSKIPQQQTPSYGKKRSPPPQLVHTEQESDDQQSSEDIRERKEYKKHDRESNQPTKEYRVVRRQKEPKRQTDQSKWKDYQSQIEGRRGRQHVNDDYGERTQNYSKRKNQDERSKYNQRNTQEPQESSRQQEKIKSSKRKQKQKSKHYPEDKIEYRNKQYQPRNYDNLEYKQPQRSNIKEGTSKASKSIIQKEQNYQYDRKRKQKYLQKDQNSQEQPSYEKKQDRKRRSKEAEKTNGRSSRSPERRKVQVQAYQQNSNHSKPIRSNHKEQPSSQDQRQYNKNKKKAPQQKTDVKYELRKKGSSKSRQNSSEYDDRRNASKPSSQIKQSDKYQGHKEEQNRDNQYRYPKSNKANQDKYEAQYCPNPNRKSPDRNYDAYDQRKDRQSPIRRQKASQQKQYKEQFNQNQNKNIRVSKNQPDQQYERKRNSPEKYQSIKSNQRKKQSNPSQQESDRRDQQRIWTKKQEKQENKSYSQQQSQEPQRKIKQVKPEHQQGKPRQYHDRQPSPSKPKSNEQSKYIRQEPRKLTNLQESSEQQNSESQSQQSDSRRQPQRSEKNNEAYRDRRDDYQRLKPEDKYGGSPQNKRQQNVIARKQQPRHSPGSILRRQSIPQKDRDIEDPSPVSKYTANYEPQKDSYRKNSQPNNKMQSPSREQLSPSRPVQGSSKELSNPARNNSSKNLYQQQPKVARNEIESKPKYNNQKFNKTPIIEEDLPRKINSYRFDDGEDSRDPKRHSPNKKQVQQSSEHSELQTPADQESSEQGDRREIANPGKAQQGNQANVYKEPSPTKYNQKGARVGKPQPQQNIRGASQLSKQRVQNYSNRSNQLKTQPADQQSKQPPSSLSNPKQTSSKQPIQTKPSNQAQQPAIKSSISTGPKRLQIRVKQPKIPKSQFPHYLQSFLNPEYLPLLCQSKASLDLLPNSHFNLIELTVNGEPTALAICCKNRKSGSIRIKHFLFKTDNYIHDLIRVCSNYVFAKDPCVELCVEIYQSKEEGDAGNYQKLLKALNGVGYFLNNSVFLPKSKRTVLSFVMKRQKPFPDENYFDYYCQGFQFMISFLTLKSTNPKDFDSDQIDPFTAENFSSNFMCQHLIKTLPQQISSVIRSNPSNKPLFTDQPLLSDCPQQLTCLLKPCKSLPISTLNSTLTSQGFDTYQTARPLQNLYLTRLKLQFTIDFPFIVDNSYMLFTTNQLCKLHVFGDTKLLFMNTKVNGCYFVLMKDRTKKLQAKALEIVLGNHLEEIQTEEKMQKAAKVGVHFMHKQLYGRVCEVDGSYRVYANMELGVVWRDYLQGGIKHQEQLEEYVLFDEMAVAGVFYQHKKGFAPVAQTLIDKADLLFI